MYYIIVFYFRFDLGYLIYLLDYLPFELGLKNKFTFNPCLDKLLRK